MLTSHVSIIRVKHYSVTVTNIEVLSLMCCSRDRTSQWMKPRCKNLQVAGSLFDSIISWNMNRLDLLPFIFLDPVQLEAAAGFFHDTLPLCSLLHLYAQPLSITPSCQRGDTVMTTKVLPECLLGKLTFPEVLPPPPLTCSHIHMLFLYLCTLQSPKLQP